MPPGIPDASLEPLLRARASGAYSAPSNNLRTLGGVGPYSGTRRTRIEVEPLSERSGRDDFVDFLHSLARLAMRPVTVPLNLIHRAITSPITLSLAIKLVLLGLLVLASAAFSILAVGAFWYSWGTGGNIELEGWLTYGSRTVPTPHVLIPLIPDRFQEDLRYDVHVELELVRPNKLSLDHSNFMLGLELRSAKNPDIILYNAAQPSLPPPPLLSSILPVSPFSIPCLLPWPLSPLCPSRLLGFTEAPTSQAVLRRRRIAAGAGYSSINPRELVLLKKDLLDGVVPRPAKNELALGAAFVTVGREDAFDPSSPAAASGWREVKTTGWVVVRFIPRPTGIRWLLSSHPIPPLILLPPIALGLTLSSSFLAFVVITYFARPKSGSAVARRSNSKNKDNGRVEGDQRPVLSGSVEEQLLAERRARAFEEQDANEREDRIRRQKEWEEVESLARGGLRKIPKDRQRQSEVSTLLGGSETTAPTALTGTIASATTALSGPSIALRLRDNQRRDGHAFGGQGHGEGGAASDATSPSDASEDETDQEVRTQSSYAPAGDADLRVPGNGGAGGRRQGGSDNATSGSGSSDEWEEAR